MIVKERLGRKFFTRPTLRAAKDLLGKFLIRRLGKKILSGKIVEVEAYIGPKDRASHAFSNRRTKRNQAEYLIGGHTYIYLVYGMYWQLNIVTGKEGSPECVLIRALETALPSEKLTNGPGKLCCYLKLDRSFNKEDLTKSKKIWLEDRGIKVKPKNIVATKRIGIDYAGKYWANKKWRFYLKDSQFASKQ